jgi:hypothetical protein
MKIPLIDLQLGQQLPGAVQIAPALLFACNYSGPTGRSLSQRRKGLANRARVYCLSAYAYR